MAFVNGGISAGPFTLSAPPVIARLTSCMPQVVTPVAAASLISVRKSSARGRWLPRWHSGSIAPGRRYLPARSIWRSAAGKNPSLPTAAILPSRMATPPSMVPPGVTIKPFSKTRSAALLVMSEPTFIFRLSQVTQVDHAVYRRWHFLEAELFPILCYSARSLHVHAAVPRYGFLSFHVKRVG